MSIMNELFLTEEHLMIHKLAREFAEKELTTEILDEVEETAVFPQEILDKMAKAGFFRWLCMTIAKIVHYQVIPIFMTFMAMSFILAMFIDSITVILFLAAVTAELASLLKFNPVPLILSEIFCATSPIIV